MRILFISPVGALFSGAEVATTNLMRYLQTEGHDIYNVIPDNGEHVDKAYLKFMEDCHIELFQLKANKWWWPEAYQIEQADIISVFAYQHKNIFQIRQLIKDKQIDLVISNTVNVFQGAIAASLEAVPHYQIIHEFPIGQFSYYKKKIDLINHLSDKIFAVTGGLFQELGQYFPQEKLFPFIPYSQIDLLPLKNAKKTRIVSIGGINQWKNQLELIQAYEKLNTYDVELVFIGSWEPEYREKLDDYISEKGLENITFLGYQKSPFKLLTDKDIIVLTSRVETFGLVYVESILSAIPTIVSDNLGHKTVSEYFGTKNQYPLGDSVALVNKINWVLKNFDSEKHFALELSQKAKELYTIQTASQFFLDQLNKNYQEVSHKEFKALDYFLGWDIDEELLEKVSNRKVIVYHSNETPYYKKDVYQLKNQDRLKIMVGEANFIRVDLTATPGAYENIEMLDDLTDDLLKPVHSNALTISNKVVFLNDEPQLVFDTSELHGHTLYFSYSRYSLEKIDNELKNIMNTATKQINQLEEERKNLMGSHDKLQNQLDNLTYQYNSVIRSRRWRITTKIINFFRRKS